MPVVMMIAMVLVMVSVRMVVPVLRIAPDLP